MIEIFTEALIANGILGIVCAFFMWKDTKKDAKIMESIAKIATIIDERLPKK